MDIEKLLQQPESKTLEFKRDLSSLGPILKTIVAFANTSGGVLIAGRAADGTLTGIGDVFSSEERIANAIAENIRPAMLPEIEIITVAGKHLLVIKVPHWRGPFYLKSEGVPKGVYVRLGSTSRPAGPDLIAEMQRATLHISYDQQPIPDTSMADLDSIRINAQFKGIDKKIDQPKLTSLGIIVPVANRSVASIGGLILFGTPSARARFAPDARVSCARFIGTNKTHILDRYEVEGSILEAVNDVLNFISRNTRLTAKIEKIQRKDIPEYPPVAVREALINALVHADYSLAGSHIQIAVYDDRLEIVNPGMLPFGFTMEDLKSGISRVRNRVIARVFRELKLMEEWGSGYKRILESCRTGGYPEPLWEELGTFIRVTFYPHPQTILHAKPPLTELATKISPRQKQILKLFSEQPQLSFSEIRTGIRSKVSDRTIGYDLTQLKEKGLIVSVGKGRGLTWRLPPS